jgi:hypothetical protein
MPATTTITPLGPALIAIINKTMTPAVRGRLIAQHASRVIAEVSARNVAVLGGAVATRIIVDGVVGAALTRAQRHVRVEFFDIWPPILNHALEFAMQRSPEDSGEYKDSFEILVDGAQVEPEDFARIPASATAWLVNRAPYARKIELGHLKMTVPPHVVEAVEQSVRRKFGAVVKTRTEFIELPNGYVLKGRFRRGRGKNARNKLRPDTQRGAKMTYPGISFRLI